MRHTPERVQIEPSDSIGMDLLGHVTFEPEYHGATHSHPFLELVLVCGEAVFACGDISVELGPMDVCLIPAGREHCFANSGSEPLEMIYIGFSFAFDPAIGLPSDLPVVVSPIVRHTEVPDALWNLGRKLAEGADTISCSLRGRALVIVLDLLDVVLDRADVSTQRSRRERLAEKARRYLAQNIGRNVTVEEVAGVFYLSPHHFGELFKAEMGVSLKEYHRRLRLQRAAQLLVTTDQTVTQIASALGYDSLHTFSKLFKAQHGQSPRDFRKTPNFFHDLANDAGC